MKILVTGCAGFIGRSMCRVATARGDAVVGTSRNGRRAESHVHTLYNVDLLQTDLKQVIREEKPDLILHAAGSSSVRSSFESPLDDLSASLGTLTSVLESVRLCGINPLIVFPSSAAVYGNPTEYPVSEDAPCHPISPYGYAKVACETIARSYARCFGLRVAVCRLFSLIGPEQKRLLLWDLYAKMASEPLVVEIDGTGAESRDYLHVDDATAAMLSIAKFEVTRPSGSFAVYNVASGNETAVATVAELVRATVSPSTILKCNGTSRLGDPERWVADVSHLRSCAPEWTPRPFRIALNQCVDAWAEEEGQSGDCYSESMRGKRGAK